MASWWATASASVRAAEPFIRSGVRHNLTFREIAASIRGGGLAIGNERLLAAIQRERAIVEHGRHLKFLPLQARPAVTMLPEALTAIRRTYSFEVVVTGRLRETGDTFSRSVTVSSSTLLTRQEIEDQALDAVTQDAGGYGMTADTAQIRFGMRAGRAGLI